MNGKLENMATKISRCVVAVSLMIMVFASVSHTADRGSLYTQVPSLVVQLVSYRQEENDQLCRVPVGTAFFIHTTKKLENLYLVTAGHVVDGVDDLYARVPFLMTQTGKRQMVGLHLKQSDWIKHPNKGTEKILPIDIAMVGIEKLKGTLASAFLLCEGDCPVGHYNQLTDDPEPPEDILVYGFPGDIGFQLIEPRPLARKGVVALSAKKGEGPYISMKKNHEERFFNPKVFLMDIDMFPGNSGSPVLRFPLDSYVPYLGGLVTATNLSDRYAIAEPVSYILELLEIAIAQPSAQSTWFDFENYAFPKPCTKPRNR